MQRIYKVIILIVVIILIGTSAGIFFHIKEKKHKEEIEDIKRCVDYLGGEHTDLGKDALEEYGEVALPYLEPLLYEDNKQREELAWKIIIEIDSPESVRIIRKYIDYIDNPDIELKIFAIMVLCNNQKELLLLAMDLMKEKDLILSSQGYVWFVHKVVDNYPKDMEWEIWNHEDQQGPYGTPYDQRQLVATKWDAWLKECYKYLRWEKKNTYYFDKRTGDDQKAMECLRKDVGVELLKPYWRESKSNSV